MSSTVLLVDDEESLLDVLGNALARAGFNLTLAQSGEEALSLASQQQYDAAVVDKNLGGMDGLEVLRHLRARQPDCACIMMTGMPSTASAVEALRLGVHDYVLKPSPELDLIGDRVHAAIRAARMRGECDALRRQVQQLQDKLGRSGIEQAMAAELTDARVQELVDMTIRPYLARDERLAESAQRLLERARALKGQTVLVAELEGHLELIGST
jgi:DNA-binding NtrC family response regulator